MRESGGQSRAAASQPLVEFCVSTTCTRASIRLLSKELLEAEPEPAKPRLLPPTRPPAVVTLMAQIGGDQLVPVISTLAADLKVSDELCECGRYTDTNHNPRTSSFGSSCGCRDRTCVI